MHAFSYFFFLYELRLMVIKHILLLYYFLLTVVNQCLHVISFCFQYSFVYLKKKISAILHLKYTPTLSF